MNYIKNTQPTPQPCLNPNHSKKNQTLKLFLSLCGVSCLIISVLLLSEMESHALLPATPVSNSSTQKSIITQVNVDVLIKNYTYQLEAVYQTSHANQANQANQANSANNNEIVIDYLNFCETTKNTYQCKKLTLPELATGTLPTGNKAIKFKTEKFTASNGGILHIDFQRASDDYRRISFVVKNSIDPSTLSTKTTGFYSTLPAKAINLVISLIPLGVKKIEISSGSVTKTIPSTSLNTAP